jgi:DNA invertase Pin-like site-specific DNA recombinase
MMVGYARVSTEEQKLDLQIQALQQAGCDRIEKDHGQSGASFVRSGLEKAMQRLRTGDTLVVWRLDRLGRSLSGLVGIMEELGRRGIHFRSITENIDTSTSGGKLMFHMMAALAEFERSIISERTKAGMAAAKSRGQQLGRPKALTDEQLSQARHRILYLGFSRTRVAREMNVCPRTLKRHIN